jgi:hypothetical protein
MKAKFRVSSFRTNGRPQAAANKTEADRKAKAEAQAAANQAEADVKAKAEAQAAANKAEADVKAKAEARAAASKAEADAKAKAEAQAAANKAEEKGNPLPASIYTSTVAPPSTASVEQRIVPLTFAGASGPYQFEINQSYAPVEGELHNGHVLYNDIKFPNMWLFYGPDGQWKVDSTKGKNKAPYADTCWAMSVDTGLVLPPTEGSAWICLQESKFRAEPNLSVSVLDDAEHRALVAAREQEEKEGEAQSANAVPLKFEGARAWGRYDSYGIYVNTGKLFNHHALFMNMHNTQYWLLYGTYNNWIVGYTTHESNDVCRGYIPQLKSVQTGLALPPTEASGWTVREWGDKYRMQYNLTVGVAIAEAEALTKAIHKALKKDYIT